MAKRRVNVPLVIVLVAVTTLVVAVLVFFGYRAWRHDPLPHIERAEGLEAKGELLDAADSYGKAFQIDQRPGSRETWGIRAGDIYWGLGLEGSALSFYGSVSKLQKDATKAQGRLVRLTYYLVASVAIYDPVALLDRANALVQMAPDDPIGYEAAAVARIRLNRPGDLNKALELLDKLQKIDPTNPAGYFLAAVIMLQPDGPNFSPGDADKLMAFLPENPSPAVKTRFLCYQLQYRPRRANLEFKQLSPEEQDKRQEEVAKELRDGIKQIAQIDDFSQLTRMEQEQLADVATGLREFALAEKIYLSWKDDFATELQALQNPPVRKAVTDKVLSDRPTSLAACHRLMILYLMMGKPKDAMKYADMGMALAPLVDRKGEKGSSLPTYVRTVQCVMAIAKVRELLLESRGDDEKFKAAVGEFNKIEQTYGELVRDKIRYQVLISSYLQLGGQVALRTGDLHVAQQRLETAKELLKQKRIETGNDFLLIVTDLVGVYERLEQYGPAQKLLDDELASKPAFRNDPRVPLLSARLHLEVHKFDDALKIVDGLLGLKKLEGTRLHREATVLKAEILQRQGNTAEFVKTWRAIDPDSAQQSYREGVLALSEKRDDEALKEFKTALGKEPAFWMAARAQCAIHLSHERKDQAIAALRDFIDKNKDKDSRLTMPAKVLLEDIQKGRQEALDLQRELMRQTETPLQTTLRLADDAARGNDPNEARRYLAEAEKLVSPSEMNPFLTRVFDVMLRLGNVKEARGYYEKLKARDADGLNGLSFEARLLYGEGNYPEAIDRFGKVLALRQADSTSRRYLALAKFRTNPAAIDEVIDLLKTSVNDNPLDRDGWYELIDMYRRSGQDKEAFETAERGRASLADDGPLYNYWLEGLATRTPKLAIDEREKVKAAAPDDPTNLLALARLYLIAKQPAKADELIGQVLKLVPRFRPEVLPRMIQSVALLYFDANQRDKGQSLLEEWIKNKPDVPEFNFFLGNYLWRLNKPEEAEKQYLELVGKSSGVNSQLTLASFYHDWGGHKDQALAAIDQALRLAGKPDVTILLRRAIFQVDFNLLDEAEKTLATIRQLAPGSLDADILHGTILLRRSKWDDALNVFNAVIAKHPEAAVAYYRRGRLLYRINPVANLDAAIKDIEIALRYDPHMLNGQPNRELADLYMRRDPKGEADKALFRLRKQLEDVPNDAAARLQLIAILTYSQLDRDRDDELDQAMGMFPTMPEFPFEAGRVAMRKGDAPKAEGFFRKALKLAPKSGEVAVRLSESLSAQKKWQAILDESEQWLKDVPGTESTRIHLERAQAFEKLNRTPDKLDALHKAVDAANGLPGLLLQLAVTLKNSMGQAPAEKWLNDYIALHADTVPFLLMRAHFYSYCHQPDKALAELDRLAAKYTTGQEGADVRYNKAIILQQNKRYKEAADMFEQVQTMAGEKTSYIVLNNYAFLLADALDQADKAIPVAEDAVFKTNREDPNVLDTLGWCNLKAGKVQKGIDLLEEARQVLVKQQREELPIVYYHLAYGYRQLDKPDEARKWALKAIGLFDRDAKDEVKTKAEELLKTLEAPKSPEAPSGG